MLKENVTHLSISAVRFLTTKTISDINLGQCDLQKNLQMETVRRQISPKHYQKTDVKLSTDNIKFLSLHYLVTKTAVESI